MCAGAVIRAQSHMNEIKCLPGSLRSDFILMFMFMFMFMALIRTLELHNALWRLGRVFAPA